MELQNLEELPLHTTLTRRELDVMRHALQGLSSKEVAVKLCISKRTVDFHLANVYTKLGVKNRITAINTAEKYGLLTRVA